MDPNYGKAYGRMGLAYSCVDKHKEAIECFKKAITLEPENESYKSNLKLAEDKLASAGTVGEIRHKKRKLQQVFRFYDQKPQ